MHLGGLSKNQSKPHHEFGKCEAEEKYPTRFKTLAAGGLSSLDCISSMGFLMCLQEQCRIIWKQTNQNHEMQDARSFFFAGESAICIVDVFLAVGKHYILKL